MLEQRLIDLETKFSYQDKLIEDLRQTVHDQYMAIEKLEKNLNKILEQLKTIEVPTVSPGHEKPPHY